MPLLQSCVSALSLTGWVSGNSLLRSGVNSVMLSPMLRALDVANLNIVQVPVCCRTGALGMWALYAGLAFLPLWQLMCLSSGLWLDRSGLLDPAWCFSRGRERRQELLPCVCNGHIWFNWDEEARGVCPPLPGPPPCRNWILQHMSVFLEGMNKGLCCLYSLERFSMLVSSLLLRHNCGRNTLKAVTNQYCRLFSCWHLQVSREISDQSRQTGIHKPWGLWSMVFPNSNMHFGNRFLHKTNKAESRQWARTTSTKDGV